MLLVSARAGISRIHGLGLIAQEFIPKGTLIWKLNLDFDRIFSNAQLAALPPIAQAHVRYYAYYEPLDDIWVLSSDDDRFTNHSDTPNTANEKEYSYAIRDIHIDEEITTDYRELHRMDLLHETASQTTG